MSGENCESVEKITKEWNKVGFFVMVFFNVSRPYIPRI